MSVVLQVSFDGRELLPVLSRARKRWHLLLATCRFIKSLVSRRLENLAKKKNELLPRSPSYRVLDIEPHRFSRITESSLTELVKRRNFSQLLELGGVYGVVQRLETHAKNGIQGHAEDIAERQNVFGFNTYQKPSTITWMSVTKVCKDPIILLLLICALLSLIFGIRRYGFKGCSDGGSIFVAVCLVTTISVLSNFWPKWQFNNLSHASNDFTVDVTRNGKRAVISNFEVVVGDIVCLNVGDQVPANGLFMDEHSNSLKVDVSGIEGEIGPAEVNCNDNPFLFSGTRVVDGNAQMLVASVGMNTEWGQMMSSRSCDSIKKTPLQERLEKLTFSVAKVGLTAALLVLIVLLIRYFGGNMYENDGNKLFIHGKTSIHDMFVAVVGIIATTLIIASTAIPEGLLLAVAVASAYSTKRMADDNNALVRDLSACEAISSTTMICTDKRGSLTLNDMEVAKVWLGSKFVEGASSIAPHVLEMLHQGVCVCSNVTQSGSLFEVSENYVGKAICSCGVQKMGVDMEKLNDSCTIRQVKASNLENKNCGTLIKMKADNMIHTHLKGAPEVIIHKCSQYVEDAGTGSIKLIDNNASASLGQIVQGMKNDGLQCVALAYKQIPEDYPDDGEDKCYTLLGLLGVKGKCRPHVKESVLECQHAGVGIKMITRAEVPTARAAAIECCILESNHDIRAGDVVEGAEFRNWTGEERMEKVDKIRVVARASSMDKLLMVQCLKQKGHVVAVTGESIGDTKAFGEADVGLALGSQGTDVAKAYADIVILDDSFVSIAGAVRWGRCIYYSIQVYIEFQLTVTIASLLIDFTTAISAPKPPTINIVAAISAGEVPFAALQLLWVKVILSTLAALALTIENPGEEIMQKPPVDPTGPFVTNIMWRNILIQAIYPIIILLTINFKGESILNVNAKVNDTLIFNTFVLWQLFLLLGTRKVEENAFKEVRGRKLFWGNVAFIFLMQILMVEFLKRYANTERLNLCQWSVSIVMAASSWPFGWVLKSIPVPKVPFSSYFNRQKSNNRHSSNLHMQ